MAHFLAVDWDSTDIRFVLATSQRGSIRVLKAESSPLVFTEGTAESQQDKQIANLAQSLKELLKRHKNPKGQLLLGLNRASIDMMTFRLPKSKPEELPDLVKNQALRDSPGFSETSRLDFIASPASEGENIRAIAAAISREQYKQYRAICKSAGYRAKRIEFRPLALAELYLNSNATVDKPVLLVQCTNSEVDMVVVDETKVVFVRSIKLPDSLTAEDRTDRIISEITRTIAVSRQEIENTLLESVILYGNADEYQSLQERLTDQEIDVSIQNPFQLNCVSASAKTKITGATINPGHYAALCGMILSEQAKSPDRIDFLHPREKPQPFNIARFFVLFLLLVGVIGYSAYSWNQKNLKQFEVRLAEINENNEQMLKEFQQINPSYLQLFQAYALENQPLIWLDELRDISVRLPDEQDLVIDQIRFAINPPSYCVIDLLGRVRDTSVLQQINRRFNDGSHIVTVHNQQANRSGGGYPISCSIRIQTRKRSREGYLQFLSPELRQLSFAAPNFPVNEPPRESASENVTTPVAHSENNSSSQNTAQQESQEKTQLYHVFPKEYVPKPAPQPSPDQTPNDAVTENTLPKPQLPHVLPVGYSPKSQGSQQHVYPGGYLPKDAVNTSHETSTEANSAEGGAA